MRIIWSPQAVSDLAHMRTYIAQHDPMAAIRLAKIIIGQVENILADHPAIGRMGRVKGTRELVISGTAYIIPYRIKEHRIEILRVFHGARRWPGRL